MKTVKKRNGELVEFEANKIVQAIIKAVIDLYGEEYKKEYDNIATEIADDIEKSWFYDENIFLHSVEDIQDFVEDSLMDYDKDLAKAYIKYRYDHEKYRIAKEKYYRIKSLIDGEDEETKKENSNKDPRILPTMRDYIAGFTCKEIAKNFVLPKKIVEAHDEGLIHVHDLDYSPAMPMHNCGLINLEDMLQNGTVISGTMIEKPHWFQTACTIATQIITQVASSQYGGNTINIAHLSPFIDESRKSYRKKFPFLSDEAIEQLVRKEIADGVQTIQYQLITMSTTNGQAPFTSIFMYINELPEGRERDDLVLLIEEILNQRIEGVKNEFGKPITIAFPKLLYVLDENNITEDGKYWYLTELAAKCSSKRLVPDYISAKKMRELKNGQVFGCMGCRSFLQNYEDPKTGKQKFWGRWNQGVCTLNLVDVALSSGKDMNKFWDILDKRLKLCYDALMIRHKSLKGTKSDVAPILWQHGAYARLKPGETIDEMLYNDYSSISLGYAGLYECVKYMTGESQTQEKGKVFGLSVMNYLDKTCKRWRKETNIGFSLYGSPIENTTDRFAKCLVKRWGEIPDITDKGYITNSYHVTPKEEINAFDKLNIESEFAQYSPGGQICYIETPNMENNIPALLEVIKYIYETNMYAEINTTTSYCHICGCTDISMGDDLKFHCPQCGNDDFNKMNVAVRVCGYISTNPFVEGRAADIHDRVYHLD